MSSELLANVAVLRYMLHFRENPNLCTGLYDADEIATAISCICILYWVMMLHTLSACLSFVYFNFSLFMFYPLYDFNNK